MPSAVEIVTCDYCSASIRWTVTATGHRLPVNAEPDDKGNQAVHTDGVGRVRSRALTKDRPTLEGAEWQAMPHQATCIRRPLVAPRRSPRPVRRTAPWRRP